MKVWDNEKALSNPGLTVDKLANSFRSHPKIKAFHNRQEGGSLLQRVRLLLTLIFYFVDVPNDIYLSSTAKMALPFSNNNRCLINRPAEISAKSREQLSGSPKIIFQVDYFSIVNNGSVTWHAWGFLVFFFYSWNLF